MSRLSLAGLIVTLVLALGLTFLAGMLVGYGMRPADPTAPAATAPQPAPQPAPAAPAADPQQAQPAPVDPNAPPPAQPPQQQGAAPADGSAPAPAPAQADGAANGGAPAPANGTGATAPAAPQQADAGAPAAGGNGAAPQPAASPSNGSANGAANGAANGSAAPTGPSPGSLASIFAPMASTSLAALAPVGGAVVGPPAGPNQAVLAQAPATYALDLGRVDSSRRAEALLQRIADGGETGFATPVLATAMPTTTEFLVRAGPYDSRAKATAAADALRRAQGLSGAVIRIAAPPGAAAPAPAAPAAPALPAAAAQAVQAAQDAAAGAANGS